MADSGLLPLEAAQETLEDLDLCSFHSSAAFVLREQQANVNANTSEKVRRRAQRRRRQGHRSGDGVAIARSSESSKVGEVRSPMAPPTLPLTLRPGIILFDPKDLELDADTDRAGARWRRKSLRLELQSNQLDDDDADGDDGGDDDSESESESEEKDDEEENQQTHEEEASPEKRRSRERARVIQEICETEKAYVRDIRTLHDHYIVALEDNKHPIMEDAQIAVFFNNLRHLVMLNSKLLADLLDIVGRRAMQSKGTEKGRAKAQAKSPVAVVAQYEAEDVGAVFCRYAPLFKLYGGYAKDYEEVAELLRSYGRDTRLGFSQFLETCRKRSSSSKPFDSLLIMPIQRIPRYKLLLERVCELTPADHPDAAFVTEAADRVCAAASLINETVRRQENLETVLQAQKQFVGQLSLFTPDRRLLKAGRLTKMSTKRQEEVMLHLFNDLLLYSGVLLTGGYRVRRVVHLHSKAVGVKTELPTAIRALFDQQSRHGAHRDCGFVVTSREKTFILFAETPAAQCEWVDAIAGAVRDAQQQHQQKQAAKGDSGDGAKDGGDSCEGPADAAALWVPDKVAGACTICDASFRVYFRRHHCRRCGVVVCGNCSSNRSPLFVGDSARPQRVCSPCFQVLDLVRQIAMKWLSRVIEFRGALRRRRWNKWSEHYFELRAGVLKQFTLETGATSTANSAAGVSAGGSSGFASSGTGASMLVGGAGGGTNSGGTGLRCCTDELQLAGAIVIHRTDSRAHKNRYCFQISTSEYDEMDVSGDTGRENTASCNNQKSSPVRRRLSQPSARPLLMSKLSPLKQAVSRFGDAVARGRESANAIVGEESPPLPSPSPPRAVAAPSPSPPSSLVSSSSSLLASMSSSRDNEWILCASSFQEEVAWRDAIQRSADKALRRMRRSHITESSFSMPLSQRGGLNLNLSMSLPPDSLGVSLYGATVSSLGAGRRRMSSLDRGRPTDAELSLELAQAAGEDRDAYLLERRRRQILKEIIRSEESYVECLGECIRLFVQPLLLRQLEGRQIYRRRQNKRKKSLRPMFGGPSTPGPAELGASRGHRRTGSSGNVGITRSGGSNSSLHNVLSASYSAAAAAASSASSSLTSASSSTPKMLVMDADMAIFFSSVDQICTLNQQLLDHLSHHLEETSAVPPLPQQPEKGEKKTPTDDNDDANPGVRVHRAGAIFHAYAPLLQLYTSYASRHGAALSALDSPQFACFLRELPAEASENRLRRYLNMPVERIPRYKMLLQELLGSTPPEHVDYAPLQSAICSVDRVASKIEEISARRENARTVAGVGAKVGLNLHGRRFVRDGTLRKVCRSKVQKYYFVLFEDAMVYGRQGGGLQKKKFRLIDLWECKVSEDTEAMPGVITAVANSNNAFCFYSPLKSFILLAESEEDKTSWTTSILECIARNLRGQTHPRRASVRSELLLDNDDDSSSGYELESAFVIKNGWLNVSGGATTAVPAGNIATSNSGHNRRQGNSNSTGPTSNGKKPRRLWITLTLQNISLASAFKAAQPEENIPIELCEVTALKQPKCFQLQFPHDSTIRTQTTYMFETQSPGEREEWVRALTHCISGSDELDLRRRSINTATLAPIFMFDKVSNVCTICTNSFAVYRPRHHCRLCGSLVCGNCSRRRWALSYSSSKKASRICDCCADSTMSITASFAAEV